MILVIIVLYKTYISDSLSYKTLIENIDKLKKYSPRILIYNNSPEFQIPPSNDYIVRNSVENEMLVGAYSYAYKMANSEDYKWLLLLDQDTELTAEYFDELNIFLSRSDNEKYEVVVPILFSKNHHLSPIACKKDIGPYAGIKKIKKQNDIDSQIDNHFIVAYNSVSLISVSALNKIGGFGNDYKLDMLDYYYYYKLSEIKSKVYLLPVSLNQNLSLLEDNSFMSIGRYRDYLFARLNFAHLIGTKSVFFYKVNLLKELLFHIRKRHDFKYIQLLIKYFFKW